MLFTTLFHVPRDSVTSPEATLSGVLSATSGVGLGDGETTGVGVEVEPRVSSALFVAEEQATKVTQAKMIITPRT
jgi:hypothetical protein